MADENKGTVKADANTKLKGIIDLAADAAEKSDITELKRCFDNAVDQCSNLAEICDSMIRVMSMEKGFSPRMIGRESDNSVTAMKEVAIAAIELAKAVTQKNKLP